MSNGNALNAILVNLNDVFVNEDIGLDLPIAGSSIIPYKNMAYALSQITNATPTNPVTLNIAGGQITDAGGQIKLKPNVNLKGSTQGTIINNSIPIVLDTSWASSLNSLSYIQDIRINGDVTIDFTGVVGSGNPQFQLNNIYVNGNKTVKGTSTIPVSIYNYGDYFNSATYDNCATIESNSNEYSIINLGTTSTSYATVFRSFSDTIQLFNSEGPFSGSITVSSVIISGTLVADPILNGTNCNLLIDATSLSGLTPTLTNGANYSLIDYAEDVNAGFTPTNYTPTNSTVKGHLEGINNEFNVGVGRVPFGFIGGGITSDSVFTYDISNKRLAVNNIRALSANIAGLNGSGFFEFNSAVDVTLTNNAPLGPYTKLYAVFTATGKKIILPDSNEPYSIQASNGGSIQITNQSPSNSFGVQTFLGDLIYTVRPLETVNIWITDNPTGSYFVEQINEDLSYFGVGYHEINNGVSYAVPNPMPTVINVSDAGSGLSITLPDMTASTALKANKSPNNFFIFNTYGGASVVNVLKNDNSALVSISPGYGYMFTVTSNATAAGGFLYELITMPSATGSRNGYLTSTDWTTFNSKQAALNITANQVCYGNGPAGVTSSSSFTFNGTTATVTCPSLAATGGAKFTGTYSGIGTALGVYLGDSGTGSIVMKNVASSGATLVIIDFTQPSVDYFGRLLYEFSNNTFSFFTSGAGSPRVTINSTALTANSGIILPTSGGTQSNLNYNEDNTFSMSLTGPANTGSFTVTFSRTGKMVILQIPNVPSLTSTSTASFTGSAQIPSRLRPAIQVDEIIWVQDNSTWQTTPGRITIGTNGDVNIYKTNQNGTFTNTGTVGWANKSIPYRVA